MSKSTAIADRSATPTPHLRVLRDEAAPYTVGQPDLSPRQETQRFTMVPNDLILSIGPVVGPSAAWLYVVLSQHANWQTGTCTPSLTTLAGECGMSTRQTIRAIAALESAGYISKRKRHGGKGDYASNEYTVKYRITAQQGSDKGSDIGTDILSLPSDRGSDKGSDTPSDKNDTLTIPNDTQQNERYVLGADEQKDRWASGFARFARAYPKKMDDEAKFAWADLDPDEPTITAILASIPLWQASKAWTENDGRFVHKPATFLRERKWLITPEPVPTSESEMYAILNRY